jgi:hypothetical protein
MRDSFHGINEKMVVDETNVLVVKQIEQSSSDREFTYAWKSIENYNSPIERVQWFGSHHTAHV